MSEQAHSDATGPAHRKVEIGAAVVMAAFGLVVVVGSLDVGVGWGAEGPKSGFFPFYIGLTIIAASIVNLVKTLSMAPTTLFATWPELRQVALVTIPTAVYVFAIPWIGIYVASVALITGFMMWLGAYRAYVAAGIAVAIMVASYVTFEIWFLVPLPKGPLEEILGL
jgi:putative tricarboxylic transport membrane protein